MTRLTIFEKSCWEIFIQKKPNYLITLWATFENVNNEATFGKFGLLIIPTSGYTTDYPNFRIWLTSSGARCRSSRSFRPTAIHVDRSCRKPFFNGDKSYNQTLTRLKTREMEQRTPTTLIHTVAANCEIFFLHQFFPLKVDSYTTKMHHVATDCCGAERWNI